MLVEKDWLFSRPVSFRHDFVHSPAMIRSLEKNLQKTSENNIKNANTKSLKIKSGTRISEKSKREKIDFVF